MEWLIAGRSGSAALHWIEALENEDETWRCRFLHAEGVQALPPADAAILLPGAEALLRRVPCPPPYLFTGGWSHPDADGACSLPQAAGLAQTLRAWRRAGRIPRSAETLLPAYTCRAREALVLLGMDPRLRANGFLPDMLALCAAHPQLTGALSSVLYPLAARRHGLNPAQVERSLRLAIEATWDRAALDALEQFFGHSVDPERGKPTNREFLVRMSEFVRK